MNKASIILILLIGFMGVSGCKVDQKEAAPNDESEAKDRNMFGMGISRGLTVSTEGLTDGYVMFCPPNSPNTYLINREGEVVHQWKGNYQVHTSYIMDDGSIILGAMDPDYPVFDNTGPYGRIQKISWNGKMLWDYEYADEEQIVHHDFAVLPNGNVLALAYEVISYEEAISNGRKAEMLPKDGLWLEKIIEVEPQGKRGGKIVWEWHVWDHLIQNYDETKANYGNPADHPELLDFNMGYPLPPYISQDSVEILVSKGMTHRNKTTGNRGADIFHFNAISYNAGLDQIVFSSPSLNEVFIIDNSTNTKEAAYHSGGNAGKGGDFLYRWGNPINYQRGDSTNRQLFGQHDVRWIEKGKPGAGNLTIFNNHPPEEVDWSTYGNVGNNYSMVVEITPPLDNNRRYVLEEDKSFGPEKPAWIYMAPDTLSFYSSFISGTHRMKNVNTFINEGAKGRFFEVTPDREIVWEYLNPYRGDIGKPNGDPNNPMFLTYSEFRSTFIPADHPAFVGKELKPLDPQPEVFVLPTATAK